MVVYAISYLHTGLNRVIWIQPTDVWLIGRSEGCWVNGKYVAGLPV